MKRTITICASVSHYKQVIPIEQELKKLGFKVLVPDILRTMQKNNNFDVNFYKTWYENKNDYSKKTKLMKAHFKKVLKGDAILIVNFEKRGMEGYIGGNVLMEITLAFHYKKPIYIYNLVSDKLPILEEIYAVQPTFLDGDLTKINL